MSFGKKGNGGIFGDVGERNMLKDHPEDHQDSPLEIGSNLSGSPSQDFNPAANNGKRKQPVR